MPTDDALTTSEWSTILLSSTYIRGLTVICGRKLFRYLTSSISRMLVYQRCKEPGHQQTRYRPTVETLYSTIYYGKYFIELNFDKFTQYVALWTHKRHPIPRPFGRAMECLLWVLEQKLIVLYRVYTVVFMGFCTALMETEIRGANGNDRQESDYLVQCWKIKAFTSSSSMRSMLRACAILPMHAVQMASPALQRMGNGFIVIN